MKTTFVGIIDPADEPSIYFGVIRDLDSDDQVDRMACVGEVASDSDMYTEDEAPLAGVPSSAPAAETFSASASGTPHQTVWGWAGDDDVFRFGQYRGRLLAEVTDGGSNYYFWAKTQKKPGKFLLQYIDWVEQRYDIDVRNETLTRNHPVRPQSAPTGTVPRTRNRRSNDVPCDAEQCAVCTEFSRAGSNAF